MCMYGGIGDVYVWGYRGGVRMYGGIGDVYV